MPIKLPIHVTGIWNDDTKIPGAVKIAVCTSLAVFLSAVPLYFILFPPLVDLPEHILISKLFWETINGVSGLQLEISWFLGYRLFPLLMLAIFSVLDAVGISFVYAPAIALIFLAGLHAAVVYWTVLSGQDRTRRPYAFALAFSMPAIAALYSACWFIGFINYSLALTFLAAAIITTEMFLRSGSYRVLLAVFILVSFVYLSHPFAISFWLLWLVCSAFAALLFRSLKDEWKRFFILGGAFLPIAVYHLAATAGGSLSVSRDSFLKHSPLIEASEWYKNRFVGLLDGTYLMADNASSPIYFALFCIVIVLAAAVLAFRFGGRELRKLIVALFVFVFVSSLLNEKAIPIPGGFWLAFDYRFSSTVYVVSLTVAAIVLTKLIIDAANAKKNLLMGLAALSVVFAALHLWDVRKAYTRHEDRSREFMAKIFSGDDTSGIVLPRSRWHPDGTLIKYYECLLQTDCNPEQTFFRVFGGDLYPVKMTSRSVTAAPRRNNKSRAVPLPDQLSQPRGLGSNSRGDFYIADTGNRRISMFRGDGIAMMSLGGADQGMGELREPNGIAVDASDRIYVLDASHGKLVRFRQDGVVDKEWRAPEPGFYGPRDLDCGPNGQLYIVDQGHTRVVRFDPVNETFYAWGTQGSEPGQFIEATGIAVGGNEVYVMDLGNDRIQVFDLEGNFLRQWAVPQWGKYAWHYPDAVFDKKAKKLYVTNGWKNQILVYDPQGTPADPDWEHEPSLENPSSLTMTSVKGRDLLRILNTGSGRVESVPLKR